MVTFEEANRLLRYDPTVDGSCLIWKVNRGGTARAGVRAGSKDSYGYYQLAINKRLYLAHRVVWLLCTGSWPTKALDHINRVRADNRIENLRETTHKDNCQNKNIQNNNTSGYIGVTKKRNRNKWVAQIYINRKPIHIGYFDTAEQAHVAYTQVKLERKI